MLYMFAILVPPLAIFMTGRPFQALIALVLMVTLIGWIPAIIWAILVVNEHKANKRAERYSGR